VRSLIWLSIAATLLIFSVVGSTAFVTAAPPQQVQDVQPLFSVTSELVMLNVTVRDKGRRYLDGLQKEWFTIFENERQQPIRFFMNEDAPVTIGLLIDNSGSMQPNRDLVVAAATAFAKTSNPRDDLFSLVFNEEVHSALSTEAPFTNDPEVLREALQRAVTTRGRTALYDAIDRGLQYVEQGSHERKVLVIVSDGEDNASSATLEGVLQKIQASNVLVFVVAIVDPVSMSPTWKRMRELGDVSGGELFHPDSVKKVNEVLQRIAVEIRHTYVMAYEPEEPGAGASVRRIRVAVQMPDKQKVSVRTRAGYVSAPMIGRRAEVEHGR
jgi:Ca-activated chloride channel family protein